MAQPVPLTDEEVNDLCNNTDVATATKGFGFIQTTIRVKDIRKSLWFYCQALGMTVTKKLDYPGGKFSAYFLAYVPRENIPKDKVEAAKWAMTLPATLEFIHNWGTEDNADVKYNPGDALAHLSFRVPDLYESCKRFEEMGIEFKKKPDEGAMKGFAFLKDPDGYPVEIFSEPILPSVL